MSQKFRSPLSRWKCYGILKKIKVAHVASEMPKKGKRKKKKKRKSWKSLFRELSAAGYCIF